MADRKYELILRINTPHGEEIAGKFFLGNSHDEAYALFDQLQGEDTTGTEHFIYFEFIEIENGLPANLKLIACTLEQAGCNMKIILKELFKSTLL